MPIKIEQTPNKEFPKLKPVQEAMNIHIPDIIEGVPNRNGFIWIMAGSGGSGKTSLLLNFFKSNKLYRGKFDNLFYIAPQVSYLSVKDHPFSEHSSDRMFHELTVDTLDSIYKELESIKEESIEDPQYSCVIIDDFADSLKQKEIEKKLSQLLIKARHLSCAFIFTLQSYFYFPKILRKQLTNISIWRPKNESEWESITKEVLHMKKEDGMELYDYVFNAPYQHLDINTLDGTLQKNFNTLTINKSSK